MAKRLATEEKQTWLVKEVKKLNDDILNISTYVNRAETAANTATTKATSASASATSAANSDTSATATAAALTNFLETKETLTAPAVDPTLTISGAAADAKVTGDIADSLLHKKVIKELWVIGTYNQNGVDYDVTNRMRTIRLHHNDVYADVIGFSVESGYDYELAAFQKDGTFVGIWNGTTFANTEYFFTSNTSAIIIFFDAINPNYTYKLSVKRADAADIDLDTDTEAVKFVTATDITLSIINEAADAKATGDRINTIDGYFVKQVHKSKNLLNPDNVTTGYWWAGVVNPNNSYVNTGLIELEQGKTYTAQVGIAGVAACRQIATAQFAEYLGADGKSVYGHARDVSTFTLPANAKYVVLSFNYTSVENFLAQLQCVVEGNTILDYIEYYSPYTTVMLKSDSNRLIYEAESASLAANTNLVCCANSDNKKNEYIELVAEFSSFGILTIAHGKGLYGGGYIDITATKIEVHATDGTLVEEFTHGLTIADFLNVIIYQKNIGSTRSSITIMSSGGDYTADTTRYYSTRGSVYCASTTAMTNVKMQYTINDAKEDVWVFGDSYISLGDPNRWATQLMNSGHKNVLLCGFGGATSQDEIVLFREYVSYAHPQYIVWALGMNNRDSGAINASWKTCVDEVIATCEEKNITPILATIPCVPSIDHTYKNAYVKASGCRYVDFAKAVNAESAGATWYAGMLSSDNTHPTALGAKALMRRFLLDVPEVLYGED